MATGATGKPPATIRPTTYYFAYGSNLQLKQMKRRCPNSKYIGYARLSNYRWQINERGYANIIEADGHWVDGLVYEIDDRDEAKLDINEGVAKNAYSKHYMAVRLYRAHSTLYRRPTAWIVNKGGPAKARQQAKQATAAAVRQYQQWQQQVLVYISLNHVEDSTPKDEYIQRINLGLEDAKVLGMEDDYIGNCIRPFIPGPSDLDQGISSGSEKGKRTDQGAKRNRSPEGMSPPVEARTPLRRNSTARLRVNPRTSGGGSRAPALPPRPPSDSHSIPVIMVEEIGW